MTIPKRRHAPDVTFVLYGPQHKTACSACHHVRGGEPYVKRTARYATGKTVVDRICPYCIFEWEAASIIVKAYPLVYALYRDSVYHRVKLIPQLELFTDKAGPHESKS